MERTRDAGRAAAVIRAGGIVAYPTETFYGLAALALSPEAVARLAAAKLRPEGKPLPLLAADRDSALALAAEVDPVAERLARRFWPGPLTLVLPAAPGLPAEIAGAGTVGVRVPGSPVARELARLSGGPITSTSANLAGEPPPRRPAELAPALEAIVDLVLDGGETPGGLPSTVVEVRGGEVRLLRAGAVPWEEVCAAGSGVRGRRLPHAGE